MFETLTGKLQAVFDKLSKRGILTEEDVDVALREVRLALLEADVHYTVTKDFLARVRARAVGVEVRKHLNPAQQVVKIVHEELIATLGQPASLNLSGPSPHVIMLVGLQGAGKTTMAAKLAHRLRKSGQRPLLVAADTYRPAAITQLEVLGKQLGIPVHSEGAAPPPPEICRNALKHARDGAYSAVILDTAGRLHINDEMMAELEAIKQIVTPCDVLLVVDAMTGQDAVRVADEFNKRVGVTGLVMTKVDGDARGGAAISVRSVTGVPIKFIGVGEKTDALEPFAPDRLANRILGMGDMLSLIEKAEATLDKEQAAEMTSKMLEGKFDLEDFLNQLQQVKKMGPIGQLLDMIPGFSKMKLPTEELEMADGQIKHVEAIIHSMTPQERHHPEILNGSRKRRVARGSGTTVQEINQLLSQFRQMQRMMKQIGSGKGRGLLSMFR